MELNKTGGDDQGWDLRRWTSSSLSGWAMVSSLSACWILCCMRATGESAASSSTQGSWKSL